ncbi:cation:proton antiporter [Streptomyces sp. NPDC090994]|uniref:cation:proton antiporter n=1 Tax=Streptomyces sp. NPDC090994 TaxID=3365969 RepID=UPI00382C9533
MVRPLLRRLAAAGGPAGGPAGDAGRTHRTASPGAVAVVLGGLLASCALSEWTGFHCIFGAFLFGAAMRRQGRLRDRALTLTSGVGSAVLLPAYFVTAGLRVDLCSVGGGDFLVLLLVLPAAVVGKVSGGFLGAWSQGLGRREATALGVLMNTRGLTGIVVLGVGLEIGLLDAGLFSVMVLMAVVTTAMTGPLMKRLLSRPSVGDEVVRNRTGQLGEGGQSPREDIELR